MIKADGSTEKIKIPIAELEGYEKDNAIATRAMELFRERWRKKHKKAVTRFTITELGNGKWEHLHIHGIIWTNKPKQEIILTGPIELFRQNYENLIIN